MSETTNLPDDPPDEVGGVVLERALRRNIICACLGWTYGYLTSGIFLTSLGKLIGLSKFQFGLLGAVPMMVFPVRLLASTLVERLGRRKNLFTVSVLVSRSMWLLIVPIPFLFSPGQPHLRAALFLGLMLLSNAIVALADPAWLSWMGDLVPEHRRATFWARRNGIAMVAPVIPYLVFSGLFDHLLKLAGKTPGSYYEFAAYASVFGFAVLAGEIDIWLHYKIPEPRMSQVKGEAGFGRLLGEPLRDTNFRRFLYYIAAATFSALFLGHFTTLYMLNVLEGVELRIPLGFTTVVLGKYGILAAFGPLGPINVVLALLLSRVWGYLMDRFGNKPVLRIITLLLVPMPLPWLFITTEHPLRVAIPFYAISFLIWSGKPYLTTNLLYALSPRENRAMYSALWVTISGIFGAIAPFTAGVLMQWMGDFATSLGGIRIESFHILCFITVGLRVIEQYFLGGFVEAKSVPTVTLVRSLIQANPFTVIPRAFALAATTKADKKAQATRRLGHTGSHMVTRDLLELLDDPDPEVRHQAALSLGHTRDLAAVEPLIQRLDHDDGETRRQAAWALGQIRSGEAKDRLIQLLADPYPHVRSAAALALGSLGLDSAVEPLMQQLEHETDPLLIVSIASALGLLGHDEAMEAILEHLRTAEHPVYRRQLTVAAGDLLGPKHTFYTYFDRELKVRGQCAGQSCRRLLRAVRKAARPGVNPAPLRDLLARAEQDYQDGNWSDCAAALAAVPTLVIEAVGRPVDLGPAGRYLQWLHGSVRSAYEHVGFERCVLGMFSLEQLTARLRNAAGASRNDR